MATSINSTTVADSEIKYDRISKDFAVIVGGQVIGYGRNYHEAEQIRTAHLAQRASK